MPSGERRLRSGGFSYLLLLLLLAVLAVATTGSVALGHALERRGAERALLDVGEEFRLALLSWRAGGGTGPAELAELLRDPRVPGLRRHLRRLPHDPLTGRAEWGLLRNNAGRIVAVYSLAEGQPIQRNAFDPVRQAGFEEAESYRQWTFGAVPVPVARTASAPQS